METWARPLLYYVCKVFLQIAKPIGEAKSHFSLLYCFFLLFPRHAGEETVMVSLYITFSGGS